MDKATKTTLAIVFAAAAGFIIGKLANGETKNRIVEKFRGKKGRDNRHMLSFLPDMHDGEVLLDEYEMLSYHK